MSIQFNKRSALWLLIALVMTIGLFFPGTAEATNKIYSGQDGNTTVNRPTSEPPIAITFRNPPEPAYAGKLFYYETYRGKFNWFSPVPPGSMNPTNAEKDRRFIRENRINNFGEGSTAYFVNKNFSWNLKRGRQEPRIGRPGLYQGDNSGTTKITQAWNLGGTTYNYIGRNYEWRYLGYSAEGNVVHNPYFPADYPSNPNTDFSTRNWIRNPHLNPSTRTLPMAAQTQYDLDFNQKVEWFKEYFFVNNPNFRRSNLSLDADARHWASVFQLQTRPNWETGILVGFHQSGGRIYYINLEMASPPMSNLRLLTYSLIDNETGQVVARATRNGSSNENTAVNITRYESGVIAGRTYRIEAQVRNMTQARLTGRATSFTPLGLDVRYSWDDRVLQENSWNTVALSTDRRAGAARTNSTSIPYGGHADYRSMLSANGSTTTTPWTVTVPVTASRFAKFSAAIPMGHFLRGDNYQTDDDVFEIVMPVRGDDIGTSSNVELFRGGVRVDDVIVNRPHTIRYYVNKAYGERPVGSNQPNNPYASLALRVTDGNRQVTVTRQTNVILNKQGDVGAIEFTYTPSRPFLETTWQIAPIHATAAIRQTTDPSNDGPYTKRWTGIMNLQARDLRANPDVLRIGVGENQTANQTVRLDFKVLMESSDNAVRPVNIVIRRNGGTVLNYTVSIAPNTPVPLAVNVPAVRYGRGTHNFTVEVNPAPRLITEFLPSGQNPYTDNIAQAEMTVTRNETIDRCDTVRTQNTWTTEYTLDDWYGKDESYPDWVEDRDRPETCTRSVPDYYVNDSWDLVDGRWVFTPGHWVYKEESYRCYPYTKEITRWRIVTDYTETLERDVNHFEQYTIDQILVRTKETGSTWTNVENGVARVQAGYGFELRPVVRYHTNLLTSRPNSVSGSYYTRSVSPGSGLNESPSQVYMEHPFGRSTTGRVTEVLDGPSRSGDSGSHRKTYELPITRADGVNVREITIPVETRPGTYQFRFDTPEFYGSTQKPYQSQMLCDVGFFTLEVIANELNDVNTHITH